MKQVSGKSARGRRRKKEKQILSRDLNQRQSTVSTRLTVAAATADKHIPQIFRGTKRGRRNKKEID